MGDSGMAIWYEEEKPTYKDTKDELKPKNDTPPGAPENPLPLIIPLPAPIILIPMMKNRFMVR
jgi:hypothetical protein